jgi:hypothetical protein
MSEDIFEKLENEIEEQNSQTEVESCIQRDNTSLKDAINNEQNYFNPFFIDNFNQLLKSFDVEKLENINNKGVAFKLKSGDKGYISSCGKFLWDKVL